MKIQHQISLKTKNTFHIEAQCKTLVQIETIDDIACAELAEYMGESIPRYILGQGSNALLLNDLDVPVIQLSNTGWRLASEDETYVLVEVAGGHDWHKFVLAMAVNGYWGVENLALIPGTVGAAPIQNIGAYGVELADVFVSALVLDLYTGQLQQFDKDACDFAYRNSFFKRCNQTLAAEKSSRYLVMQVTLQLSKVAKPQLNYRDLQERLAENMQQHAMEQATPQLIADTVIEIRQEKLPNWHELGCAGSFFKNPVVAEDQYQKLKQEHPAMPAYPNGELYKVPAGWLIEQAGWKGFRDADAGVYEKQALVLVNHGNATGAQIKILAERISKSVFTEFGIALEQEVIDFY